MTAVTESDIKELKDLINNRFDEIKTDIKNVETRLTGVEDRLTNVETRLTGVEDRLTNVETRLTGVEDRLTNVETRLTGVENRLINVETRLTVVETRMDEWRPAIQKIPDLAEKIGELKNWRQIIFTVITATIGGVIGWFIRFSTLKP